MIHPGGSDLVLGTALVASVIVGLTLIGRVCVALALVHQTSPFAPTEYPSLANGSHHVSAKGEAAVAQRDVVIAELRSRIVELEAALGQDSGNSSDPPVRDKTDRRARRAAEAAERKTKRAKGGKPRAPAARRAGVDAGTPGADRDDHPQAGGVSVLREAAR